MAGGKGSIWGIREAPSVTASGEREAAWTLSNQKTPSGQRLTMMAGGG